MKAKIGRVLRVTGCVLLWLAAAVAGLVEGALVLFFLQGRAEIEKIGPGMNLYLEEYTHAAGIFAMFFQLPILLTLLIFALAFTRYCLQRRTGFENEISD